MHQLAIFEKTDGRAAGRVGEEMLAGLHHRVVVHTGEDGGEVVGTLVAFQGSLHAWAAGSGCTSAHAVHNAKHGAALFECGIHLCGGLQFSKAHGGEVGNHGGGQFCWVHLLLV
jgi:hypothetical protein